MRKQRLSKEELKRESILQYMLSDLGLDLTGTITLPRVFLRIASLSEEEPALIEKREGKWCPTSYRQLASDAQAFAASLVGQGVPASGRVALFLRNSPAWVISDLGTMFAGGVTVPIYETLSPGVIRHILRDSQAVAAVVEDAGHLQTIEALAGDLPDLKHVIVRRPEGVTAGPRVHLYDALLSEGREATGVLRQELVLRLDAVGRDDVASIIYTSGTTGDPKGVMLTHRNFLADVYGVLSVAEISPHDTMLSILPLSHAFERTVGYYCPLLSGARIAYAEGIKALAENLREVRPTICAVVPLILERMFRTIGEEIGKSSPIKRALFRWAHTQGMLAVEQLFTAAGRGDERRMRHRPEDRREEPSRRIAGPAHLVADQLIFKKIRAAFGGRLRYFVAGGAPLSADVVRFFSGVGIPIYEGYGLTETSPIISFNYQSRTKAGTVGKLLPYVQVKFAPDGEILVKGPNVMLGYHGNPQATAEVLGPDGWLHTGDVGRWDEHHYLQITGRKKELIVLATGKNVPPIPIEEKLKAYPEVAQALVLGNVRKYVGALIFPSHAQLRALAREKGVAEEDPAALCTREEIRAVYSEIVDRVNEHFSPYEQVKRFALVPEEIDRNPELVTPTLKLKRAQVERTFKDVIEDLYR